ncbi:MAG: BatA domain-containing protein [Gammaproteobacteria bacterium]
MTLLAPAFLAGLLAIGLPLWLHRLSSTNPNRRKFSSLMFLEPGEPRRVLAKKLQYLFLLALRIAVLALLALVFAQPARLESPAEATDGDSRLHVLVIDASASMAHESRWERALDAARRVLDGIRAGDRVQVVAAARVAEIATPPTDDVGAARDALATLTPTPFRLDYGQLMRALDGVVRAADRPVTLHIVTDGQQSAMPARFAELAPDRPALLEIHDVADAGDRNWAIESFTGSPLTGRLEAEVVSFAPQSVARTLRLSLNGRVVQERRTEIPANGRVGVEFDPLELESGPNRVELSLVPGDDLAIDDRRYLSLRRPEPRDVLIVSGGGRRSDDLFVRAALETAGTLSLAMKTIAVGALADEALAEYDFVIVLDAGVVGPADAASLKSYAESGGRLLVGLGPRSSGLGTIPILELAPDSSAPALRGIEAASISGIDASHPALRGLDGLRSGRFFRYVAVAPAPGDDVLLELDTGAPLLVEREIGDGRVLLYASTLDREWNDMPVQPAFVPLVAGLANYLLGGAGFSNEAPLGATLSPRALGMQGGQIYDPDGRRALGLGGGSSDVVLDRIGFYEVIGGGRTEVVAVNVDPRESDLTRVDDGTLQRWQALGFEADEAAVIAAESGEEVAVPLGPWLLGVLIAALLMESLVANWHLRVRRGIAA